MKPQEEFHVALRNNEQRRCLELLVMDPGIAHSRTPLLFGGQSGEPADFAGRTHSVLTAAANMGARDVVEALLNAGADIASTGMFGETALHTAAWLGYSEIVALLLIRGAPLDPRDSEVGGTPFQWAVHGSSPHAWADKKDQVGAARLLANAGAEIHADDLRRMERDFAPLPEEMKALLAELGRKTTGNRA